MLGYGRSESLPGAPILKAGRGSSGEITMITIVSLVLIAIAAVWLMSAIVGRRD